MRTSLTHPNVVVGDKVDEACVACSTGPHKAHDGNSCF